MSERFKTMTLCSINGAFLSFFTSVCLHHRSSFNRCLIVLKTLWPTEIRSRLLDGHIFGKMNSAVSHADMPMESAAIIVIVMVHEAV